MDGKDSDGKIFADPHNFRPVLKAIERADKYPSRQNLLYCSKMLQDCFPQPIMNTGRRPNSIWDDLEEQYPWITIFNLPEPLGGPDPRTPSPWLGGPEQNPWDPLIFRKN